MTQDEEKHDALRARAATVAGFLHLPFRRRTWRGQTGDFLGAGAGSSLDFQDHRHYVPGDDPRHINWQAYARTGNYSMKLYREEVRPMVDLVLDVSPSMFYEPSKETRSLELLYFAVESAVRSGASLATFLVAADRHARIPEAALRTTAWVDTATSLAPADPGAPPALARLPLRSGALRLFVSDLLWPGNPGPVAAALATRGGRGLILAPFCDAEARPLWQGNCEFIDVESGTRQLNRVEPALVRRFELAYRRHFDLWKTFAVKHGIVMARVPASGELERALQAEAALVGALEPWT